MGRGDWMDAIKGDDRRGVKTVREMTVHRFVWSRLAYQKVLLGEIAILGMKMSNHAFTRSPARLAYSLGGFFTIIIIPLEESDM